MKNKKSFWKRYWLVIIALIFIILSIVLLFIVRFYLLKSEWNIVTTSKEYIDFNYYLSSSFNNWFTPIIMITAALLTFLAFFAQYQTNLHQYDRIDELNEVNKIQAFETIFFKLLENYHKLIDSITFDFEENIKYNFTRQSLDKNELKTINKKGILCLIEFCKQLNDNTSQNNNEKEADILSEFNKLYIQYSSFLFHLLRNLYLFVKFIDEKDLPESEEKIFKDEENKNISGIKIPVQKNRYEYMKILGAQLPSDLLIIIAINGLTKRSNFANYTRKYRLLKNLDLDIINVNIKSYLLNNYSHIKTDLNN
jgi:hypothetical protein